MDNSNINFKPISTSEKLWFANKYIKLLKDEIRSLLFDKGVLNSNHAELLDTNKYIKVRENQVKQIKALENKNKNLRLKNDELMKELIKLKLIININKEI